MISIYWNFKPLDTVRSLWIESFNEATVILLNTLLVCFTDYVPSGEDRNEIGFFYLAVIFVNIGVHLTLLIASTIISCK